MGFKIGVDVGGTFTDFLLMDGEGNSEIFKVLSSSEDSSIAVFDGFLDMAKTKGMELRSFLREVEIGGCVVGERGGKPCFKDMASRTSTSMWSTFSISQGRW